MANTDFTARCMAGKALDDVAGKQDVIADLGTIRAGAAAGATAVQPATLENYQPKIDSSHKLDTDLVDDTNSTNKFATQTQLDQIELNKNNISLVCDANGKKQLIPNFGILTSGTITYTQSGTSITVSGTKENGSINYVNICTAPYSAYGLKEGDTIVVKNSGASFVYVGIGFDTGSYTGTPTLVIGSNELTVPSGKTHMFIRIGLLNSVTSVNETITPLVCDKKLYSISPTITPYAMSNAELTAKEQTNENNILSSFTMVAHASANGSTSLTYDTNINDFNIGGANSDKSSGSYLIICTNWSTTPAPYVGLLTFSGATGNKFVKTDVVTGFSPTITITQNVANATIDISGAAKISIYATK